MKTRKIITTVWACDLQGSSDLSDEEKSQYNKTINSKLKEIIEKYSLNILSNQFRGDGKLIVFDPNSDIEDIFSFANEFCESMKNNKEKGSLGERFYIRSYLDHGKVQVENEEATGDFINAFCRLIDNKQSDKLILKGEAVAVFVITSDAWKHFEDDKKRDGFEEIKINERAIYTKEYHLKNLRISLKTDLDSEHEEEFFCTISNCLKDQNILIVENDEKNRWIIVVGKSNEYKNIYIALKDSVISIYRKTKQSGCNGHVAILIEVRQSEEYIKRDDLLKCLDEKEDNKLSVNLVWADISLDLFKTDKDFVEEIENAHLIKYVLTEKMRIYSQNFSQNRKKLHQFDKSIRFSELNEKCIYLHSFDYGGNRLIREIVPYFDLKQYLHQQLEMGLILCDGVIIHSAEILRTENIFSILKEYEEFIEDGSIKLLFSSKINSIKDDFKPYIQEKIKEYDISEFGDIEAKSLKDAVENEKNLNSSIELLLKCPNMIKRNGDGTSNLEDLINDDLAPNQRAIILEKNELSSINLVKNNYSLYQLLNARYLEQGVLLPVIQEEYKQDIIGTIEQLVNGVISASIVNRVIELKVPETIRSNYKGWYYSLINRANTLYAKINTGDFLYMEYLPSLYKNSIFDYTKFTSTFPQFFNVEGYNGSEVIKKMRAGGQKWEQFKLYYLNSQLIDLYMDTTLRVINRKASKDIEQAQKILEEILS